MSRALLRCAAWAVVIGSGLIACGDDTASRPPADVPTGPVNRLQRATADALDRAAAPPPAGTDAGADHRTGDDGTEEARGPA